MSYPCKKCGKCCRNVGKTLEGVLLAREDGVCRYLDEKNNLCKIYDERPVLCNIDKYYDIHLKGTITREEFYKINQTHCRMLTK